jgi:membrane protein
MSFPLPAMLTALYRRAQQAELGMIAASVAFFGFLSIFPAVAAIIAIWGFVSDPTIIRAQVAILDELLPAEVFRLVDTQISALLAANSRQLGWATLFSTLATLWAARNGVAALIHGVNAIHHLPPRSGLRHLGLALLLTLCLVGVALCALIGAVIVPVALNLLPLGPAQAAALEAMNAALAVIVVAAGLALFYRYGPNRPRAQATPIISRGLLLALLLWAAASRGFAVYLSNFGSYNQVYGSIGAVVALLIWIYLSAYAVLLGAAVDAETSR